MEEKTKIKEMSQPNLISGKLIKATGRGIAKGWVSVPPPQTQGCRMGPAQGGCGEPRLVTGKSRLCNHRPGQETGPVGNRSKQNH